jgi:hypothetical protein
MGQMRMEQENNIFKAIRDYGVDVDKDELIKALQYDRDQYEKGYINGYNRKASEVALKEIDEIESATNNHIKAISALDPQNDYCAGGKKALDMTLKVLAELKKKYTEDGE